MEREKVVRAVDSCFDYWLDQHRYLDPLELEKVRQRKEDALFLLKEQEVTQKDGYNLQELWKRARSGETLNETELNFLLADWDERNIFKQTVGSDQIT